MGHIIQRSPGGRTHDGKGVIDVAADQHAQTTEVRSRRRPVIGGRAAVVEPRPRSNPWPRAPQEPPHDNG